MKSRQILLLVSSMATLSLSQDLHHHSHHLQAGVTSLTDGWQQVPFSASDYNIQIPCNSKLGDHYSFVNGVHTFTVKSTDLGWDCADPHKTKARSEMSLRKLNYNKGSHQFQAWITIPKGTHHVDVM